MHPTKYSHMTEVSRMCLKGTPSEALSLEKDRSSESHGKHVTWIDFLRISAPRKLRNVFSGRSCQGR